VFFVQFLADLRIGLNLAVLAAQSVGPLPGEHRISDMQ
jgi:hypothetical protein